MDARTIEVIGIIVALVLGLLGMKPMNWLKEKFGLENGVALLAVYLMSGVVAALALLVAGQFADVVWTIDGVIAFGAVYFAAATAAYKAFA